jgi:microcystin-dependent protein
MSRLLPKTVQAIPSGSLFMFAGAEPPEGYLLCDGSPISRVNYSSLFDAIGTTYGSGDGSTTFNLPDFRGRGPLGAGTGAGLTPRTLGGSGGAETVTLDTTMIPSHTHTGTTASDGSHSHSITDPGHAHTQTTVNDDFNNSGGANPSFAADSAGSMTWSNINSNQTGISINSAGAHTHTFTSNPTGGGNPHANMSPFLIINFIIKS